MVMMMVMMMMVMVMIVVIGADYNHDSGNNGDCAMT
jgi:hypothetical protein